MLPCKGSNVFVDVTKKASAEYSKCRSRKGDMAKIVGVRYGIDFYFKFAFHTYSAIPVWKM
jgi:hypothetical protein